MTGETPRKAKIPPRGAEPRASKPACVRALAAAAALLVLVPACNRLPGRPQGEVSPSPSPSPSGGQPDRAKDLLAFTLAEGSQSVTGYFYPDGQSDETSPEVWLLEVDPGGGRSGARQLIEGTSRLSQPAISPAGDQLVAVWEAGGPRGLDILSAWSLPDGKERSLGIDERYSAWSPTFSPDGDSIAFVGRPNKIVVQSTSASLGDEVYAYKPEKQGAYRLDSLRWSPSGKYFAAAVSPLGTEGPGPVITVSRDGIETFEVARFGGGPGWHPREDRLYYPVPAVQEPGELFDPSLPALVMSSRPDGSDKRQEVVAKASDGLGYSVAVGNRAIYYVAASRPSSFVFDSIVAVDFASKARRTIYKAPEGYVIYHLEAARS